MYRSEPENFSVIRRTALRHSFDSAGGGIGVDEERQDPSVAFNTWIRDSSNPDVASTRGVELYKGRKIYKSATMRVIADPETGEVRRHELRLGRYAVREIGPGFDFDNPEKVWSCDDEQIGRLRAFLNDNFQEDGEYIHVGKDNGVKALVQQLASGELHDASLSALVAALISTPGVADALASAEGASILTTALERSRHRRGLDALRRVVEDPTSSEQDLQEILQDHWWVFGGRYVGQAARRKLTLLDQFDIPLIRSDGALHVVELKKANVPNLIVRHRNHLVVGPDVHLATAQAMSYLRSLDRQETVIAAELGLDCHRAFATVVIGHSAHLAGFDRAQVSEALRTYNSHLARIEVVTYEDLLDGAEQALKLGVDEGDGGSGITDEQGTGLCWDDEPPF